MIVLLFSFCCVLEVWVSYDENIYSFCKNMFAILDFLVNFIKLCNKRNFCGHFS